MKSIIKLVTLVLITVFSVLLFSSKDVTNESESYFVYSNQEARDRLYELELPKLHATIKFKFTIYCKDRGTALDVVRNHGKALSQVVFKELSELQIAEIRALEAAKLDHPVRLKLVAALNKSLNKAGFAPKVPIDAFGISQLQILKQE